MNKYEIKQSPLAIAVGTAVAGLPAHAGFDDVDPNIVVTTTDDAPIGTLRDKCTLRAAVESALTQSAVDGCETGLALVNVIGFDSDLAESVITLSEGEIEIRDPEILVFRGPLDGDPGGITIDGGGKSRLFNIEGGNQVGMKYLTLSGGRTEGNFKGGAAVYARDATLYFGHVAISGNRTEGRSAGGGAVYAFNNVDLTILNSTISSNRTEGLGSDGGAIYMNSNGTLKLAHSRVKSNQTTGEFSEGGGIFARSQSVVVNITDSTISGNSTKGASAHGGGIGGGGSVTIERSKISNNSAQASSAEGGGVFIEGNDLHIFQSTVSGNSSGDVGGGVFFEGNDLHIFQSTISGNSSGYEGGGVYLENFDEVRISQSTISGNSASVTGGGVHLNRGGELLIHHSTVAYNTSQEGAGGLHVDDQIDGFELLASLVVQGDPGQSGCNRQPVNHHNSLSTDAVCAGTSTDVADIGLGPLADNGGLTETHALSADSVAIDAAGDCRKELDIDHDQRGLARPGPGSKACDVGAFEFGRNRVFSDRFEQP